MKYIILFVFAIMMAGTVRAQEFDFDCPTNYILDYTNDNEELLPFIIEFVADAKGRGHEIEVEDIYGVIATQKEIRVEVFPSLNPFTFGVAIAPCSSKITAGKVPAINFVYVKELWVQSSDYHKKRIIYHELGHSVFGYKHTTAGNEIMTGGNWVRNADFLNATHRLFSGENQTVYNACTGVEEPQDIYFNTGINQDATPLLRAINFTDLPGVNGRIGWYSSNANYSHIKEKGSLNWENIIATRDDGWAYDFDLTGLVDRTYLFLSGNYNNESKQTKMRIIKALAVTHISDDDVVTIELPLVLLREIYNEKITLGPFGTELIVEPDTGYKDDTNTKIILRAKLVKKNKRQRTIINQLINSSGPLDEVIYMWFERDIT